MDSRDQLDRLHDAAAERGYSVGIRLISFHPDTRTGHCRQSLLGTLEVRDRDGQRWFHHRDLIASCQLVAGAGFPERSVDEAAGWLLEALRTRK